ncbi:MAG: hypothetical protein CMF52_02395 [Legionellales bacterium]|nr:hypothetical protein [Legionellales bacterium]
MTDSHNVFDLSVVVPTYNRAELLREMLLSLQDELTIYKSEYCVEIIISDNASTDKTREVANSLLDLNINYSCNNENVGVVRNIINACESASGRFVLLMSDDDLFIPGAISELLPYTIQDDGIGIVSGPVQRFSSVGSEESLGPVLFSLQKNDRVILKQGFQAFSYFFLRASTLSALMIRRDLIDIAGVEKHVSSLYPQVYFSGKAAKLSDAVYLPNPVVKVRDNPITHWVYSDDFMASAVINILKDLVHDEPWGSKAFSQIVRQRIWASYGPLYESKERSLVTFFKTLRSFAMVKEYRQSATFWSIGLLIGLLGTRLIAILRRCFRSSKTYGTK